MTHTNDTCNGLPIIKPELADVDHATYRAPGRRGVAMMDPKCSKCGGRLVVESTPVKLEVLAPGDTSFPSWAWDRRPVPGTYYRMVARCPTCEGSVG
jgi:hypothetical protein